MFTSYALIFTMDLSVIAGIIEIIGKLMFSVEYVLLLMNSKPDKKRRRAFRNIHSIATSLNHNREKSKQNCFRVSFGGIL